MTEHLPPEILQQLEPVTHDVGGLPVRRALPVVRLRHLGPFVFLDHMGPASFAAGEGVDVPPHPHIGLSTVTYLFEGRLEHRDSLGVHQGIEPGAVNWMTAGRGIVHSERSGPERAEARGLHGMQAWVALPTAEEECAPSFVHHAAESLPTFRAEGLRGRVLVGTHAGHTSPVDAPGVWYAELQLEAGARTTLDDDVPERGLYVATGAVRLAGARFEAPTLLVLAPGAAPLLEAEADARCMLLGGDPLDGPRTVHWNFVSSRRERIQAAREAWSSGAFPDVPDDPGPPVPLPGA